MTKETNMVSSCCEANTYHDLCMECNEHCSEIDLNKLDEAEEMNREDYQR